MKIGIKRILSYKKTKVISVVSAIIIIAALAVILLPGALSQKASDPALTYTNEVTGCTITFPESWRGRYILAPASKLDSQTFIQVYDKANNDKYKEENQTFGWLFTIMKLDNASFDELWQSYRQTGGGKPIAKDDKYIYMLLFPTDVEFDANDQNLANSYKQSESDIDKIVASFISENKLEVYDFITYKQKYITPFVNSGVAFMNWTDAEQNEPGLFLETYKYAASSDKKIDFLQYARDNGIDYAVPRDIVESAVTKYFNVSTQYLRTMERYNGELQCYVDQYNGSGPEPSPEILSYAKNGDSIVIKFENTWSDPSFAGGTYEVGIKTLSDGSFKYTYSKVLSGADHTSPIERNIVSLQQKYYDYFDKNNWQITSLLAYDNANGFDDACLMTFAIMGMPNYSYENGNSKDEIDKFLIKYFGHTVKNYVTNVSEYVPGTDRVRATGWSYDSSTKMVLKGLASNSDGTKTGYFNAYTIPDTSAGADIRNDLLSGNSSVYGQPKRVVILFEEAEDKDGLYLKYKTVTQDNAQASMDNTSPNNASFNADKYLSDDEITISGIKMGMSYEQVLDILGGYDEAYNNSQTVKSITKDGIHFGFYQIDPSFTNQSDLKIDGVFRLLDVSLSTASQYQLPRGIKIGDSIEDVLSKFPGNDKKLRKWAYQNIYGKDQAGSPRAYLEFTMYDECYHFTATTTKQVLVVNFNRKNQVSSIQIIKEDS